MSETIKATWSDAARKAAAEARNAKRTWEDRGPNEDRGSVQILHHEHGDDDSSDAILHTKPKAGKYRATVMHKGSRGSIKISHDSLAEVKKAAESHLKRNYSDVGNARISFKINSSDEDENNSVQSATSTESSDVVRAAGTSEGAKKGAETKRAGVRPFTNNDWMGMAGAERPSEHEAPLIGDREHPNGHSWTAVADKTAVQIMHHDHDGEYLGHYHMDIPFAAGKHLVEHALNAPRGKELKDMGFKWHGNGSDAPPSTTFKSKEKSKASDVTFNHEVIHCRSHSASGPVLAADKPWSPGEQVEFMWMPAGTSTICAGFRKGSIELTVNCDENTAAAVQASLESWREERPKQEPFGCIEHKEQEASFRVGASCGFKWNDDGVYLAAEPTTLGANNVNGRVHRSWSPSFTTDADYSKATERGGVLMFPEGVRGSRSNPAQITGVDFCVGTLTNKPAFHSMSPVKASDAVQAQGNSEGAKKGWEHRDHIGMADNHYGSMTSATDRFAMSGRAHELSDKALKSGLVGDHFWAAKAHKAAAKSHGSGPENAKHTDIHKEGYKHHREKALAWQGGTMGGGISKNELKENIWASESITAHCAETLKQDVPDATPAEVACYEKCLEDGGSHTQAVEEIRKQRNPAAKASLEEIYDKVTAGEEAVKAMWSDAARKAALEARRHSAVALDEPLKRSMDGKPRADLDAYDETKKAHAASKKTATETGKGGYDQDSHNYAQSVHLRAAKAHEKAGDSHMAALHEKAADAHKAASIQIHKETWANKASEPTTPDTILARQASVLEQANAIATEHGVARTTLDDVYSKCAVQATWSPEARAAALASRKAHSSSGVAIASGKKEDHGTAAIHHLEAAEHYWADDDQHPDGAAHSKMASRHMSKAGFSSKEVKDSESEGAQAVIAAIKKRNKNNFKTSGNEKAYKPGKPKDNFKATDATPEDILNKIYASSGHSTNVVKAHCGKLLGLLGSLRAAHWNAPTQTNDHEALGELYETLDGLVDEYVESSMGKKPEKVTPESCDCDPNDPAAVLDAGERIVTEMRGDREDLNNLVADMEKAINKTRYLLKAGAAGGPIQTSDKSVDDILNSIYARAGETA